MQALSRVAALLLLAVPSLAQYAAVNVESDALYNGTVIPEATSITGYLDAPKLSSTTANETTYDWWYFDAVSASTNESVTVVFYNSGPDGFINTYETGPYSVQISGSFANGSLFNLLIDSNLGATFTTSDDGSVSAYYLGSDNASFVGTGLTEYVITIDAPSIGVAGTISFSSLAPAHYPCGANVAGVSELMTPHVFWANALPDALTTANLVIGDTTLTFEDGVGYHDKNWGDAPFVEVVTTWYWGHAHVGPYSIVWFDALDADGIEHFSGYVAEGGSILETSCADDSVLVRPWGANDAYPPLVTTGIMQGIEATFLLADGSTLVANITTGLEVVYNGVYLRTLGSVEATYCGETYTGGRALFEEFKFLSA